MAGHSFSAGWQPTDEDWNDIPGLVALGKKKVPQCFLCTNGCGLSLVSGTKVWCDFGTGTVITDTSTSHCPNRKSATDAEESASGQPSVRHPRVDVAAMLPKLLLASLNPKPDPQTHDERYVAQLGSAAKVALNASHTIEPSTLRANEQRLSRQIIDIVTAELNAIYVKLNADGGKRDFDIEHRFIIKNRPGSEKSTASAVVLAAMVKMFALRGITDRVHSCQSLQQGVFRIKHKQGTPFQAHQVAWIRGMHESIRPDLAALRDTIERPDRVLTPLNHLQQNPFIVFGAALITNDTAATRAFFRTELPRELSVAKKIGWKAPADGGTDEPAAAAAGAAAAAAAASDLDGAGDSAGAAARPSPVRAGAKPNPKRTSSKQQRPQRKRPRNAGKGKDGKVAKEE